MKVRIGVGAGRTDLSAAALASLADDLVELGFDSIWLSEVLTGGGVDPLVGLAFVAAHNAKLKLGTTMLLPGRNPVRMAKALASLDSLSNGRLLVTLVPGLTDEPERSAIGLEPRLRSGAIDEVMPLLRALWSGQAVSHEGPTSRFSGVHLEPQPVQQPLELWLGGMAPSSLVRCGRLGDGWLPSFCTPVEAVEGRRVIEEAADAAERTIDPEHFGVSIAYASQPLDDAALARARRRGGSRRPAPELPVGVAALRGCLEAFIEVGFSKFVVRPLLTSSWRDELELLAAGVGDLQT
jgi:probable F420-dependent oxidoreductase